MSCFSIEIGANQSDDGKNGNILEHNNTTQTHRRQFYPQGPTGKKRDIVVGQKNEIAKDQQNNIDNRFLSKTHSPLGFSRSHLPMQDNPQNEKVEEEGDNIPQGDTEMKGIQWFYGKDPKSVIGLKPPGGNRQSQMGNEDDNERQQ